MKLVTKIERVTSELILILHAYMYDTQQHFPPKIQRGLILSQMPLIQVSNSEPTPKFHRLGSENQDYWTVSFMIIWQLRPHNYSHLVLICFTLTPPTPTSKTDASIGRIYNCMDAKQSTSEIRTNLFLFLFFFSMVVANCNANIG